MEYPKLTELWHRESSFLILLAVPDETALGELAGVVRKAGISTVLWREPDWDNSLTAIAVAPDTMTSKLLANYPLTLREPRVTAPATEGGQSVAPWTEHEMAAWRLAMT